MTKGYGVTECYRVTAIVLPVVVSRGVQIVRVDGHIRQGQLDVA
jgi:hypothetical protein